MKSSFEALTKKGVDLYVRTKLIWVAAVIVVFALIALQRFLWATETHGVDIRTDSVAYLWSSENLAKGIGLGRLDGAGNFRPYTHWPPLYPILLTIPRLLGVDGMESARIIGAICISLLIAITGFSISRLTARSPFYTAGALLVLINAPVLWITNLSAMSEPLYMVLGLSALLLMEIYIAKWKYPWLIAAALLMGLALVTRYVGISLLASGLLFLMIQKNRTWMNRLKDGLILSIVALFPLTLWVARNMLVAGTSTNRTLRFVPIAHAELQHSVTTMLGWLNPILIMSPTGILKPALIVAFMFVVSGIYYKFCKFDKVTKNGFAFLLVIYTIFYTATTLSARLLFDPFIPLDESRILFPLFTGVFLLIVYLLFFIQEKTRPMGWLLPAILASLYVLGAWIFARDYIKVTYGSVDSILVSANRVGMGMARFSDESLITVLDQYPLADNRYFTDNIEKLYFSSSFYSYQLLSTEDSQVNRILSELDHRGVVLILFDNRSWGPEFQRAIPDLELIYSGMADVYVAPAR